MYDKMKQCTLLFALLIIAILLITLSISARGQSQPEIRFTNSTYAAWQENLPFWFWANQKGQVSVGNQFLNLSVLDVHSTEKNDPTKWQTQYGTTLVGGWTKSSYLQFNQAYASIAHSGWLLKAGLFFDKACYNGLSTTNGNLARSLNARPYPKIRFSTNGFKSLPFWNQRLSFKAEYDEGILNDKRYVKNAKLHHKSFYLAFRPAVDWYIETGAEHFVMWGGTSPDDRYGQLPEDFKSYLRYITGSMGGDNFPQTDQLNVAGNQLGTYQVKVVKSFENSELTFYASHPFEDFSGVNFRNWPDNLLGLSFEMKDKSEFISHIVYEFINTRQQSIRDSLYEWNGEKELWERMEYDNYYNHGYYRSGFTYHHRMMGSPLFSPLKESDGITTGIRSNRFYAHHLGLMGNLAEFIKWKGLFTFLHHIGTYSQTYENPHNQLSVLVQLDYSHPGFPVDLGISGAADAGNQTANNIGIMLRVSGKF